METILNPTDDVFRREADLCRLTAEKAATEELRLGWLRLAAEWQSMTTPLGVRGGVIHVRSSKGLPAGPAASR